MAALAASCVRREARYLALQSRTIRAAVWAEQDDYAGFLGRLGGAERQAEARADTGERDAALAAFGLRAEQRNDRHRDDGRDGGQNEPGREGDTEGRAKQRAGDGGHPQFVAVVDEEGREGFHEARIA